MGNHIVGNLFAVSVIAIEPYIDDFTQEEAKEAFDRIWAFIKESYYYSGDAEFDDWCQPSKPLGRLIVKVFDFHNYEKLKVFDYETSDFNKIDIIEAEKLWADIYYEKFKKYCNLC